MEKDIVRTTYGMEGFLKYFDKKRGDSILCITHTDMDGIMAGSIVANAFQTNNWIMANYGKNNKIGFDFENGCMEGKDVIITDYSFSTVENIMDLLNQKPKSLSIFDHHMNTLELAMSEELDKAKNHASQNGIELFYDIDINRCGTKIIFDALKDDATTDAQEKLVDLVDTYDRWKFTKEDLSPLYLNDYLYGSTQTYVMSPAVVGLFTANMEFLEDRLKIGKAYHDIKEEMNKLTSTAFSFTTEFKGYKIKAIEARGNSTLLGNAINEFPFVVIFHYDQWKKSFVYSMFKTTDSDADILSIAKSYGGGGHTCACGFTSDERLITPF